MMAAVAPVVENAEEACQIAAATHGVYVNVCCEAALTCRMSAQLVE